MVRRIYDLYLPLGKGKSFLKRGAAPLKHPTLLTQSKEKLLTPMAMAGGNILVFPCVRPSLSGVGQASYPNEDQDS